MPAHSQKRSGVEKRRPPRQRASLGIGAWWRTTTKLAGDAVGPKRRLVPETKKTWRTARSSRQWPHDDSMTIAVLVFPFPHALRSRMQMAVHSTLYSVLALCTWSKFQPDRTSRLDHLGS
ncbi:hypothetical protein VTN77DRAFT_5500 [Rasamsonia byssochlamydoides]|uniref:uncharacterized protein n=1 Tax=Rasamsonia byssochlamydoides TaxID=89139 RepID=UPI0037440D12